MLKTKINSVYAYSLIVAVAIVSSCYFYARVIDANIELENIYQNADYGLMQLNQKMNVPKIKSVTIGNNGKLQVRGFVPAGWMFEGQMPAEIIKNGQTLKRINCYAEGSWTSEGDVPFLCEVNETKRDNLRIKIMKDNPSGEEQNAGQIILPLQ